MTPACKSYAALDLDGLSTSADGYLLVGGSATSPDAALPAALDDGAAAVALVIGDGSDFPPGTPLDTTAVIDANCLRLRPGRRIRIARSS